MRTLVVSDTHGKTDGLEEVLKITSEDSFYNAEEAVESGLATGIIRKEC